MTEAEIIIAKNLGLAKMLPGSWDKRFAQAMASRARDINISKDDITESQREWLIKLGHKYRRQMPTVYKNHVWPLMPEPKPEIDFK